MLEFRQRVVDGGIIGDRFPNSAPWMGDITPGMI
jgi:hypothetical protein